MHRLYIIFFSKLTDVSPLYIGPQYPFGIHELFSRRVKNDRFYLGFGIVANFDNGVHERLGAL